MSQDSLPFPPTPSASRAGRTMQESSYGQIETTPAGPFHHWPTEIGPPRTPEERYHLSEDLADDAISWLHRHKAFEPDKPFFPGRQRVDRG